jgi:endonuclease YncB( thermonuclease family)
MEWQGAQGPWDRKKPPRWRGLLLFSLAAVAVASSIGYFAGRLSVTGIDGLISAAPPQALVGRASVIDGDTVEIQGQRVRFNGIDAPESNQRCENEKRVEYFCGRIAAAALDDFLAGSRPTRCEFVERDQYGRLVGDCYRADGSSVATWLVRNGHAMDWPRYSGGAYANHQAAAKSERVGLWVGRFQPPWEWRAEQANGATENRPLTALGTGAKSSTPTSCTIKGNINARGERIYHVPGQRYYAETRIDTARGERLFCSEDEARRAGWRKSKV